MTGLRGKLIVSSFNKNCANSAAVASRLKPQFNTWRMSSSSSSRYFSSTIESTVHLITDNVMSEQKVEGQVHDPHLNFATATYNVIWHIISGQRFQWDDPFLGKLIRNLDTNLEAMELVGSHNYITLFMSVQCFVPYFIIICSNE